MTRSGQGGAAYAASGRAMQPVADIVDADIEIPEQGQVAVRHIQRPLFAQIEQLATALASAEAHNEALVAACTALKQQVDALKAKGTT